MILVRIARDMADTRMILAAVCMTLGLALAACDGSESSADAAVVDATLVVADAAVDAAPGDPDAGFEYGVVCGDVTCRPDTSLGCCVAPPAEPYCWEPEGAACTGDLISCDGIEDCGSVEDVCCDFGQGPSCTVKTDCIAGLGGTIVCHHDDECSEEAPNCCDGQCTPDVCI
jgi:hypothetical protein